MRGAAPESRAPLPPFLAEGASNPFPRPALTQDHCMPQPGAGRSRIGVSPTAAVGRTEGDALLGNVLKSWHWRALPNAPNHPVSSSQHPYEVGVKGSLFTGEELSVQKG